MSPDGAVSVGGRGGAGLGPPGGALVAEAAANIAFIKYWGARDLERAVPLNRSVSMTLARCRSRCALEPLEGSDDRVLLVGPDGRSAPAQEAFAAPVAAHLERIRRRAGGGPAVRVTAANTFPAAAGLASSASGFAALTLAAARLFGLDLGRAELSDLARSSGSGSAARSVFGGYVEWPSSAGASPGPGGRGGPGGEARDEEAFVPAGQLAPAEHWALRDVIAIVDSRPKEVSSREGHRRSRTSPYMERRLEELERRVVEATAAVRERDLARLGPVLEEEAVDLHLIAMSSRPPIFYWAPGTLEVLEAVRGLRAEGVPAWSTIDAGPNVHVICEPEAEPRVASRLEELPAVRALIRDGVGAGPRVLEQER